MRGIKTISQRVTPVLVRPKHNNFVEKKDFYIAWQFRYMVIIQSLFCINRLYLLKIRKCLLWVTYIYAIIMCIFLIYFLSTVTPKIGSATIQVMQNTSGVEFILLVFFAVLTKKKLKNFYEKLGRVDDMMNVYDNIGVKITDYRSLCWLIAIILYGVVEYGLLKMFLKDLDERILFYYFITTVAHDSEQVFFFTMMRVIFIRLKIVKAHVFKLFCLDEKMMKIIKMDKFEMLSDNADLDVTSVHKVYESLHKCSEQLNTIMSFPVLTLLN